MARILVAGKTGQLAFSLVDLADEFGFDLTCMEPPELDLTDSDQTRATVLSFTPDILINAAAYTAVDAAEENQDLAFAINRDGTAALAEAAAELDIPFLHVSTDYVYAGDLDRPYVETDPTGPTGVYGSSKLAGEDAAFNANDKTAVFRNRLGFQPLRQEFRQDNALAGREQG